MLKQEYNMIPIFSLKMIKEKSVKYPVNKIMHADIAAHVLQSYLQLKDCENLVILLLDNQNNFLGMNLITTGSISNLSISVRDVIKHAIVGRASAIILGHNHPSGDVTPSQDDVTVTNKIKEACEIIGVRLLDHIIVNSGINSGKDSPIYSFMEKGML